MHLATAPYLLLTCSLGIWKQVFVSVMNDQSEWCLVRCETALPDPHSILSLSQLSPVRTVQGRRQSKEQGKDRDAQGTWLCLWSWCSNGLGGVKMVHALFGTHPNLTQPWVSHLQDVRDQRTLWSSHLWSIPGIRVCRTHILHAIWYLP